MRFHSFEVYLYLSLSHYPSLASILLRISVALPYKILIVYSYSYSLPSTFPRKLNATRPRSKDKHNVWILMSMHNRPQHYANKSPSAIPASVLCGLSSFIHWMERRWTPQSQSQHNGGEKSNSGRPARSQRPQSLSYVTGRVSQGVTIRRDRRKRESYSEAESNK